LKGVHTPVVASKKKLRIAARQGPVTFGFKHADLETDGPELCTNIFCYFCFLNDVK